MGSCWYENPEDRPSFDELVKELVNELSKHDIRKDIEYYESMTQRFNETNTIENGQKREWWQWPMQLNCYKYNNKSMSGESGCNTAA